MSKFKSIFALLMLVFVSVSSFAQKKEVTISDYERFIDARLEMNFRNEVIKELGLTSKEIAKFDKWYRDYTQAKSRLVNERMALLEDYMEEMKEDDKPSEEEDDTADFIEDYWEVDIAEMELKKDFFDRLEDLIPLEKAMNFFIYEERAQRRAEEIQMAEVMPIFFLIDSPQWSNNEIDLNSSTDKMTSKDGMKMNNKEITYKNNIDSFDKWVMSSKGKVDLSHDYTHDGLDALANAITSVAAVSEANVERMYARKNAINRLADQLKKDKWSDKHADFAKKAFMKSVKLLEEVAKDAKFESARPAIQDLKNTVKSLDKTVLLTKQKQTVYNFFEKANIAVQALSKNCEWKM